MKKCFLCHTRGKLRIVEFNNNTLQRCKMMLMFRRKKNFKYNDITLNRDAVQAYGYHSKCYQKITVLKNTYKEEFMNFCQMQFPNETKFYTKSVKSSCSPAKSDLEEKRRSSESSHLVVKIESNGDWHTENGDTDADNVSMYNDDSASPAHNIENEYFQPSQCFACGGEIKGLRYRCVQCRELELCGACELAGAHAQHYVLRAPTHDPQAEVEAVLAAIRHHLLNQLDPIRVQEPTDQGISFKSEPSEEVNTHPATEEEYLHDMNTSSIYEAGVMVRTPQIQNINHNNMEHNNLSTWDNSIANTGKRKNSIKEEFPPDATIASCSSLQATSTPIEETVNPIHNINNLGNIIHIACASSLSFGEVLPSHGIATNGPVLVLNPLPLTPTTAQPEKVQRHLTSVKKNSAAENIT